MKPETILKAMIKARDFRHIEIEDWPKHTKTQRHRQYLAFRNRILKMFAEKDARIAELQDVLDDMHKHGEIFYESDFEYMEDLDHGDD